MEWIRNKYEVLNTCTQCFIRHLQKEKEKSNVFLSIYFFSKLHVSIDKLRSLHSTHLIKIFFPCKIPSKQNIFHYLTYYGSHNRTVFERLFLIFQICETLTINVKTCWIRKKPMAKMLTSKGCFLTCQLGVISHAKLLIAIIVKYTVLTN